MASIIRCLILAGLLVGSLSITLFSETSTVIPDTQAAQHVRQHITVEGVVVEVFTGKHGNTFLSFGARYPHQTFTGWIPKDSPVAKDTTLSSLKGKRVRITGMIELHMGKPEIRINSKEQITGE
jgi:DNA/RNA endonuclease YhcR with UshA esterase domain